MLTKLVYIVSLYPDKSIAKPINDEGEILVKLQERYSGLIAGRRGLYHEGPLFAKY
jgi:hypothetical protein